MLNILRKLRSAARDEGIAPKPVKSDPALQYADLAQRETILYISRGAKGLRPVYSEAKRTFRVVDTYAENVPEALIDWCAAHDRHLIVLYESPPPELDGKTPYAAFGDRVSELLAARVAKKAADRSEITEAFSEHYASLLDDNGFRDAFSYQGVNLFEALDRTPYQLANFASAYAYGVRRWTHILETLKPDAVVAGRLDVRPEICLACSRLNIRSVGIKLGIAEEMLAPFAWSDAGGSFNTDSFPDVIGLWGEAQKALIEERFPKVTSRLVVSGRTRNDTFSEPPSQEAMEKIRARLSLEPSQYVIVYGANQATKFGKVASRNFGAACMSPHAYGAVLRELAAYAHDTDSYVIVKPHPSDDIDYIARLVDEMAELPVGLLTDKDGFHNAEILAVSDVFVSSVSSMFSEAVLAGKPAINIWTPDVNYLYEGGRRVAFSPISITAESGSEIVDIIRRLRSDQEYYEAEMGRMTAGLEGIFGASDGGNARRLVDLALEDLPGSVG